MNTLDENAVAMIIGASGGIGLALTQRLLDHSRTGCVWAACRRPDNAALAALAQRHGDRLRLIAMDVGDSDSIAEAFAVVESKTPQLHLLMNAFGFLHDADAQIWPEKRIEDISAEGLEANFRINAMAPALIARQAFPLLNHRQRAVFASLSARVGSISDNRLGGWYAYRASKAAQNMLTRSLAVEAGRRAKRLICLALHPGTTDSALSAPFQSRVPQGKLFTPDFAASQLLARIDNAGIEDSGQFYAWDGEPIPW